MLCMYHQLPCKRHTYVVYKHVLIQYYRLLYHNITAQINSKTATQLPELMAANVTLIHWNLRDSYMSSLKYRHLRIGTTVFVDGALVYLVIIMLSENYEASTSSLPLSVHYHALAVWFKFIFSAFIIYNAKMVYNNAK